MRACLALARSTTRCMRARAARLLPPFKPPRHVRGHGWPDEPTSNFVDLRHAPSVARRQAFQILPQPRLRIPMTPVGVAIGMIGDDRVHGAGEFVDRDAFSKPPAHRG